LARSPIARRHDHLDVTGGAHLPTHPDSKLLFPSLSTPTATLWAGDPPTIDTTNDQRGAMMPRRKRTRAKSRAERIAAERRLNAHVAERNKPPPF
jgi:hypothetical protein